MKKCQIFTPNKYVKYMLDVVEYTSDLYGKKILENSFGEGNFLVEIIERYIIDCKKNNYSNEEIVTGLANDIYGFEIDRNIYFKCLERIKTLFDQYGLNYKEMNLYNSDSLISDVENFDYIVGNPPYISYRELDKNYRAELSNMFESCKEGKFDYCYAFIEKSLKALKTGGKFVYIIPNSVLKNVFGKKIRDIMINSGLEIIVDNFNSKVFENANVSPTIIKITKGHKETIKYIDYSKNESEIFEKDFLLNQDKWIFKKNYAMDSFNEFLGNKYTIGNSIATLLNCAYVISSWEEFDDKYIKVDNYLIERQLLREAASPKYLAHGKKEMIIYPYYYSEGILFRYTFDEFFEKFPKGFEYLKQFKSMLERRNSDKNTKWFEYGRSQALRNMNSPKLLLSIMVTNKVKTFYLEKGVIPYSGIYIVIKSYEEYKMLKKELESDRFLEYIKSVGIKSEGNSMRITCSDLKKYKIGGELLWENLKH